MRVVLVTGMLASGKTIALQVLQDLDYYVIDNLSPSLIWSFLTLAEKSEPPIEKAAFVIDVRAEGFFDDINKAINYLRKNTQFDILFIDADDEVLIARYKLSRRRHLMFENERIEQTLLHEREKLASLKDISDYLIDTTDLNEAQFKKRMHEIFGEVTAEAGHFMINIVSFGFKYGMPQDCDLVFDARFAPNPFYIDELKPKCGLDKPVSDYVMGFDESRTFLKMTADMINYLLPYYIREGKTQLVVGIGCSGGRHRSVAFSELLKEKFNTDVFDISVEHRDINKDKV